jgi:hypothetical protein
VLRYANATGRVCLVISIPYVAREHNPTEDFHDPPLHLDHLHGHDVNQSNHASNDRSGVFTGGRAFVYGLVVVT